MRISHALLTSVLMLTFGAFLTTSSALADTADPYADTYCDPIFTDENGNEWQDCYTARGVTQLTQLPSGDYKYTSNGTVTNITTANGIIVYRDSSTYRFTDMVRDGDWQVARSYMQTVTVTTDPSGEVTTCTLKSNVVAIDGEPRADIYSFECGS